MVTIERTDTQLIRDAISQRIADIDDPAVLDVFFTIADKYHKPKPLTPEQLKDFEIGRQQIADGLTISHEVVMKEFDVLYPDDED